MVVTKKYGLYFRCLSKTSNGFNFLFMPYGEKTQTLSGNIPKIVNKSNIMSKGTGKRKPTVANCNIIMSIDVDEYNNVVDYNLDMSEKNVNRLSELGYNNDEIKELADNISFHKRTMCKWVDINKMRNPYANYPFKDADIYFQKQGGYYQDPIRLTAMKKAFIEDCRANHNEKYATNDFFDDFRYFELNNCEFARIPNKCLNEMICNSDEFLFDGQFVWDKELKDANEYIKKDVSKRNYGFPLVRQDVIDKYLDEHSEFSEEQKDCIKKLTSTNIDVITGGAGVGKTTVIKGLIDCYSKQFGKDFLLLAPTGKASRRIASKCGTCEAFTIHHALRKSLDSDYIHFNEYNKLPFGLIVVDESSMIDTLLMADLLKAVEDDAKIIFVGDYNQLEAVGCGSPFHDFIKGNNCEVLKLTQNFRQASDDSVILENANGTLNGKTFKEGKGFEIKYIKQSEISNCILEDVLNITPYVELCKQINYLVYKKHKDNKEKMFNDLYYVGARVVFTKNTDEYSNGDTGIVAGFNDVQMFVKFDDCDKKVVLTHKDMENIKFAYSLTAHKVQGSEYDTIKVFLPKKATSFSANPNLLYTIVTRAKKNVCVYFYE